MATRDPRSVRPASLLDTAQQEQPHDPWAKYDGIRFVPTTGERKPRPTWRADTTRLSELTLNTFAMLAFGRGVSETSRMIDRPRWLIVAVREAAFEYFGIEGSELREMGRDLPDYEAAKRFIRHLFANGPDWAAPKLPK